MKQFKRTFLLLASALFMSFLLPAQVNLTNGLVAYYPFNGNANDASGNNNHGTLSGTASIVADQWGNSASACNISGPNNPGRITVPNSSSLQFSTTASFAFWFKLNSNVGTSGTGNIVAGGSHCLLTKDGDAGGGMYMLTALSGSNLNFSIGNVSMTTLNYVYPNYTVGTWLHCVYIMDAGEQRFYINGNLVATVTGASNFGTMNNRQFCMGRFGSNWYPINGAFDEVRIYNRVLTTDEITALSNSAAVSADITSFSPSTVCAGDAVNVNITANGTISAGNDYSIQLSDATGGFSTPITIGTLNSNAATATIPCIIPDGTPSGTGYKLRVVTSLPASTGTASTASLTVNGVLGDIPAAATFHYLGNSGGRNYYVSNITQTWTQAQTTCAANGGHLAYIPDVQTNALLNAGVGGGAFIGYTDQVTEGTWVWENNYPSGYTNWYPGEPNNSGNEDYGHMLANGQWNDVNGSVTRLIFLQLSPATSNSPVCSNGTITLFAANLTGATYQWSGPNGFTSLQQNPVIPNVSLSDAGTYTVTITKGGCSATATTDVIVNQSPDAMGQSSSLLSSLSSGLVLYYPMNGNANDASGNGLNGTMFGGITTVADRFGNAGGAMQFNGSNAYIDAPDANYFTGSDFTVSCWVKVNTYASWSRVFDFGNGAGNNNVLLAISNGTSGRPSAEIYNGTTSGGQISPASTTVGTGQWSLLIYRYSAGTGKIYLNGTQIATGTQTAPQNVLRTFCYIGRSDWAADAYANASFDEFRIYNRALSSTEITSLLLEQPDAMNLVAVPATICPNTASAIKVIGTQKGVSYQLQNASTSANIGAAQNGNSDTLSFSTGNLAANTTFQVVATGPGGCSVIISSVTVSIITPAGTPTTTGASRCEPGSVTLSASGAPVGAVYYWYTAPTGGTQIFIGPSYTTPVLNTTTTYYVSIYANGCESNRTPVTATINLATAPAVDLYSGLIMHYKMDGNTADSSGRGNNATVTSGTYVNDRFGTSAHALQIISGNYVDCGTPSDIQALTNQVTISMWLNENYVAGGQVPLLNDWGGTGLYSGINGYWDAFGNQQNRIRWRIDGNTYLESGINLPFSQWTHVVCTYNGTTLKIYQNGQLTDQLNYSANIGYTGTPTQLGRQANGAGSQTFPGDFDEVRVYSRALNADEVMALYFNGNVAFSNSPVCEGSTLVLSSPTIAGATYSWTGPNGFTSTQEDPAAITNVTAASAGTYSLVITGANGCISAPQVNTVVVNPLPSAPATVNDTVCASGNATLTASGGSSYNWYDSPTGGSVVHTGATWTISNLTATDTFYVSIVSAAGCESPARTMVIAYYQNPIQTSLPVSGSTVCASSSSAPVDVQNSQNGVSYQAFYNSTAVSASVNGNGGTVTLNVNTGLLPTGSSTITIVATQAFCGSSNLSNTAVVVVNPQPSATITNSGPLNFCTGGSVTLSAPSGLTYSWSEGSTSQSIVVNQSGSYSFTVTDSNGCSSSSSVANVTVLAPPVAGITAAGATTFCQGGSVTLNASGGGTYAWSNGATTSSVSATQSGNYYVIVSNGSCEDTSTVIAVTVNPLPNAAITVSGPTTFCTGGSVLLTSSAGSGNLWSDNSTGNTLTVSTSGNYDVTVTDANGCSATSVPVSVNVLAPPVATITASGPTTFCQGDAVLLTAGGGSSYDWSDGSTSTSVLVSQAGTYYVVASNGTCTDTSAAVNIVVNALPNVSFSMGADTFFCVNSPAYTLTAGTPAGGSFSGPDVSGNQFDPSQSGTGYVPIVYSYTDPNGCSASASSMVYVDVCTGIAAGEQAGTVTAMPNPTNGVATVYWPAAAAVQQLEVFDATGRIIIRKDVSGTTNAELSLNGFAAGIYQVKLSGDEVLFLRLVKE